MLCLMIIIALGGAAGVRAAAQQLVDVRLETFGVKSHYRAGDFTGIRVLLTSNLNDSRNVQVVWEVPDAQGDIAELTRLRAVSPGQPTSIWLYGRLQPIVDNSTVFTIRVYEDNDGVRGRELGGARIAAASAPAGAVPVGLSTEMIGVVGGVSDAGLGQYNLSTGGTFPDTGHEFTQIVSSIQVNDLPDRWEGLDSFRALVWTTAQPTAMTQAQAEAIRDWIRRGGQLVIIIPQVGSEWQFGPIPMTPLHPYLPQVGPTVGDSSTLELLEVLSKRRGALPAQASVPFQIHHFERYDNRYEPLLVLSDGRVVMIDRRYGFGRITIVGIDLASGLLTGAGYADAGGLAYEAEVPWNIILGRRQDTLSPRQIQTLAQNNDINNRRRNTSELGGGRLVTEQIALTGRATAGIGLALILFIAYWVLAGPGGFALLKGTNRVRHAWLMFFLTSVLFTALAWTGVKLFSQTDTQVRHLTFIDFLTEQSDASLNPPPDGLGRGYCRVSSWFTIFLPGYGKPVVSMDPVQGERNLLTAYSAPGDTTGTFTNVDRYRIDIDDPSRFPVPSRSTTKEMHARYIGPPAGEWAGFEIVEPITVSRNAVHSGRIIHGLPGTLRNARMIVVTPERPLPKEYLDGTGHEGKLRVAHHGQISNIVQVYALRDIPGLTEVGLTSDVGPSRFDTLINQMYRRSKDDSRLTTASVAHRANDYFFMLSFYHMITPPEWQNANAGFNDPESPAQMRRLLGREVDLSHWLTRPCVIIYGELTDVELPLPLLKDGVATNSSGRVIVRWIHPLPVEVKDVMPAVREEDPF